ncbi:MAG: PKD domain-containing protein [Phycisphaerae bacterium]
MARACVKPPVLPIRVGLLVFISLTLCEAAFGAPPKWWNKDWPYRVRIECEPGEGDVASVRVTLAGRTTKDGRDLRLVDADGRFRNFEILYHDRQLNTLVQLKVPPEKPLKAWLYYGNTQAKPIDTLNPQFDAWQRHWNAWKERQSNRQRALQKRQMLKDELIRLQRRLERVRQTGGDTTTLERRIARFKEELKTLVVPESEPAPNKPEAWYPRRGILLRVYRKAKEAHPNTLTELRRLIRRSQLEGAGFCRGISDGFNRFGPSEHYISVYEGYLRIDAPGTYRFCTVSDDGSWVRINDRTVVEWPGAHGWQGAERGEKNGEIKLGKGVARVQYYHEEGTGGQMAFLGWQRPGQERFWGIPREQWLGVRAARALAYEARNRPVIAVPTVRVLNTYWVRDSDDRQATLVEFRDRSRSRVGKIVKTRWSFGDGLEGEGAKLRHVYFRTGRPEVTLSVTDARGNTDSVTCFPNVFYVDVRARYFRYGSPKQYVEAAAGYDVEQMAQEDLQLYAEFWGYLEKWSEHVPAVEALIRRFPDLPAIPQLAASAAKGCTRPEAYDPQRAEDLYRMALGGVEKPLERMQMELRRAEVIAWGLEDYQRARALLNEVLVKAESRPSRPFQRLRRQAVIALGDVALLSGEYGEAERLYRQAQQIGKQVEQAEMLSKTGGYGYTVTDLLARGEFDWALEVLDRWEGEFPVQKLEGYMFFLRGKVLYVQRPGPLALRYLELAERVSPRAVHVPEAVWLWANCLLAMGRYDEALAVFERICSDFTQSEFYERAAEKIELCQARLKTRQSVSEGG